MKFIRWFCVIAVAYGVMTACSTASADGVVLSAKTVEDFEQLVALGDYPAAINAVDQLPISVRDAAFAWVTLSQIENGDLTEAAETLRDIESTKYRRIALSKVTHESQGAGNEPVGNGGTAQGGGSMADFTSLMELIQSTVAPEAWESLGGASTMAPYPQGIVVDTDGTVREVEVLPTVDAKREMGILLFGETTPFAQDAVPGPDQWRRPSRRRVVSLRRLRDDIVRRQMLGQPIDDSMVQMAGISEVSHLVRTKDDVLIAGEVGGIALSKGWYVDQKSGMHPLRFDFLVTACESALSSRPFGCTIDPTPDGLARAAKTAIEIQSDRLPVTAGALALADALGKQDVKVFGIESQTQLAMIMIEADRHMKRLALGHAEMPEGVPNYLDQIDNWIAQGPPSEVMIRLWFRPQPQKVQADKGSNVFRLSGRPIVLSGQNELETAQGRARVADDPRTVDFVAEFNAHFSRIRSKYPIYGAMESVYRTAAIAEICERFAADSSSRALLQSVADMAGFFVTSDPVPKSVDSIAVLHNVRHGRKRHHILVASGGVWVETNGTVRGPLESYPTLANDLPQLMISPSSNRRWWWDAVAK
ncbi:hypothetical protein CA13_67550 [Planctomycetes bacterium CA13]|uniref:Secreted protein n=1 Tax=Novipirellula herctigrandis TaxID=2527986 RepID=A0A5C5YN02_9BACT|nr:hypothetical protein CA13_67550 [Planctomycetes bacterium CA13]